MISAFLVRTRDSDAIDLYTKCLGELVRLFTTEIPSILQTGLIETFLDIALMWFLLCSPCLSLVLYLKCKQIGMILGNKQAYQRWWGGGF